jgi:hypothetical protein
MLRVAGCIADRIRFTVPQATEWQHIGNQIDAAMITARANFVSVQLLRFAWLEPHGELDGCTARRIGSITLPSRRAHWHHGGAPIPVSACQLNDCSLALFPPYCVTDWAIFNNAAEYSCLAPKIDLLMYSTFAVQSGRKRSEATPCPRVPVRPVVEHRGGDSSRKMQRSQ